MDQFESENIINQIPNFRDYSLSVSRGIHGKILEGGRPVRRIADFFHGSWLGGELTFRYSVGVNRSSRPDRPKKYTAVIDDEDLPEQELRRVEFEGTPILLYRYDGGIYAIGAVCGHDGGPLDEGRFDGYCVECPWHQSVYDLRDGRVVHGPTAYAKPSYDTRVRSGKVEIRLRSVKQGR